MISTPEKLRHRKAKQLERQRQMTDVLYRMERDRVLRSLDPQQLMAHFIRWKRPIPESLRKPEAALAIMHRARLELPNFDMHEKFASATWLIAHHYMLPKGMELRDGVLTGVKYI